MRKFKQISLIIWLIFTVITVTFAPEGINGYIIFFVDLFILVILVTLIRFLEWFTR